MCDFKSDFRIVIYTSSLVVEIAGKSLQRSVAEILRFIINIKYFQVLDSLLAGRKVLLRSWWNNSGTECPIGNLTSESESTHRVWGYR